MAVFMKIAIDLKAGASASPESAGEQAPGPPEWTVLQARLLAARDASRELSRGSPRQSRGSFASDVAHQLAGYEEDASGVNLTDSVNRKRQTAKVAPAAGDIGTGGRGQT
jgi:hypothetical protein